jgi:release factor glutamine methyltransferase
MILERHSSKSTKEQQWLLKEKYDGVKSAAFREDVKRLQNSEPLDYVIGFSEFLGCRIDLSLRPFIPRHETEFWTQKAIEDIRRNSQKRIKVLDIFAGSGCVGLAVLKHDSRIACSFADVRERFLFQIKLNSKINQIEPRRFRVVRSDVFSHIQDRYDYILANPPYVADGVSGDVDAVVLKYEPREAVLAGRDGLVIIKKFLKDALGYLNPGGKIYMEFGAGQGEQIQKILAQNGYYSWQIKKDQFDEERYVKIKVC